MKRYGGLLLLLLLALVLTAFWISTVIHERTMQIQRRELAEELGVSIEDYPYEGIFPLGYFYASLEKGMRINEVHQIVRGYDQVYHCGQTSEIYYFYGTDEDKSLRYRVLYDRDQIYQSSSGEDDDSRTFNVTDCQPGLLPRLQE